MTNPKIPDWKRYNRISNAQEIVNELKIIPLQWSLTPLEDKTPKRKGWQEEEKLSHGEISDFILFGDRKISKRTGNEYISFCSGFGLRTGDYSDGLIAIDVDGISAQPLLDLISGGDVPNTVKWTSGKTGRYQILFQIPPEFRENLAGFSRKAINEWGDLKADSGEQLEFRYNRVQSALPPSRHPTTGSYKWLNSPQDVEVAIAPDWLINLVISFKDNVKGKERKVRKERTNTFNREAKGFGSGIVTDLVSFLNYEVLPKLSVEQIYNWTGHNFQDFGQTLKGNPRWRESESKISFHVWWDGEQWAWQDKSTGDGGGAVQYRWMLKGFVGTPKGKDYVSIVEELANDAGLTLPTFKGKAKNRVKAKSEGEDTQDNFKKLDWKEEFEIRRSKIAQFEFTRNPDIKVEKRYLPTIPLENIPKGIIGIKGDWGIGKSHLISSWCATWLGKIIQVAHLNGLLENTAPKFGCRHHRDLKELREFGGLHGILGDRLAITDISLGIFLQLDRWSGGQEFILILDEIEQVLNSIQTNTNLKGQVRLTVKTKLEWLIRNATYVICSDKDLSDITLNYVEQIRGDGKKTFIIQSTELKGVNLKPITIDFSKRKDNVLTRLIEDAKAGKKLIVPCENKSDLLAIEQMLIKAGVTNIFSAHGNNSNETDIKLIIESIDKYYTDYQIFLYTMTLGTAVSLDKHHFDKLYAFLSGDVLSAAEQSQMLFRYRPDIVKEVWVSPKKRTTEIVVENLMLNLVSKRVETDNIICSIDDINKLYDLGIVPNARLEISEDDIPWIKHKLAIIARKNASLANPSRTLITVLEESGFNLEFRNDEENEKTIEGEEHKEQKKEIKDKNDEAIANAKILSDEEFEVAQKNAGSLSKKQRDNYTKTIFHKTLGVDITKGIVKLERTKKLMSGAKMLRILLGDEATAIAHDLKDRRSNPDINDQFHYSQKRNLLMSLGVLELIEKLQEGWTYNNDSPAIIEIADKARSDRSKIKKVLGFSISLEMVKGKNGENLGYKDNNSKVVGLILSYLCIERKRNQKGGLSSYELDLEHWALLEKIISHQNSQTYTPTLAKVIEDEKNIFSAAENLIPQGLDPDTHPPDYSYINKKPGCVSLSKIRRRRNSLMFP
ncbi:plasmid replication protein, CyRepA1 family [Anabaena sp. UHCC 0253]|uniref:plasmid replication protein, CyRepA1 family n=1 Tax=Anabaena sp. UHCC 0253 TaxID=2590019 RepID=UPI0014468B58|nr:plasmid replication protein, CyRepA1 family [Anabaena sp. UHCC 0253]